MSNSIRIKRRASGNSGGPSSLKNGELAFNEVDNTLYYGKGTTGGTDNAATVEAIGGVGFAKTSQIPTNANFVDRTTDQSVGGIKTLTALLNADGGIAVDTNKFTVAANGNTSILGTLAVDGVTTADGLINADGGIAVDTNKFTVAASDGDTSIAGSLSVSGPTTLAGVSASTLILTTDLAIADGGTGASTAAAARTNLDVDQKGTDNSTDVTLAGTPDYITISGQVITRHKIDLNNANDVSGTLPSGNLPTATATAKGAIELFSNTVQSEAANSVSNDSNRTYGVQLNSAGQAVVNVPWEDTTFRPVVVNNTTIGSGETLTLTSGENVTLTESNGEVTITAPVRTVKAGNNTLLATETLELKAGNNVTITENGGVVEIASSATATKDSLGLDFNDDVVFKSLELGSGETTATLKGPAELVIDPATHGNATGKVVIEGDLQVEGTTTTVNSTVIEVADKALDLAPTAANNTLIDGGGFRLGTDGNSPRGGLVEFLFSNTNGRMELNTALKIGGSGLEDTVIDGGTF